MVPAGPAESESARCLTASSISPTLKAVRALEFWKAVTVDRSNLLESLISLLGQHGIRYCVIDGQAVNAYVEPVVTLDLDLVVAAHQIELVETLLKDHFQVERFPYTINVSMPGSNLRVQIQTDPLYFSFVDRASEREILGLMLPVASAEDVLQGKVWAVMEPKRRASKRQKDLADIARLIEAYPELRQQVPAEILERLL